MKERSLNISDNLYIRLMDFLYNCSKLSTDYYIARSLLANISKFPDMTIQEVADESFTTKASVTKFCQKIGYQNFHEMRFAIEQPIADKSFFYETVDQVETVQESIEVFLSSTQEMDKEMFASYDYNQIKTLSEKVAGSESIALVAPDFTFESVNLLKELLHSLGVTVFIINRATRIESIVEMVEEVDLTLYVSMTGNTLNKKVVSGLSTAKTSLILVTTDMNQNLKTHRTVFEDVVVLNRSRFKESNYVSSKLYANYFIALYYQINQSFLEN